MFMLLSVSVSAIVEVWHSSDGNIDAAIVPYLLGGVLLYSLREIVTQMHTEKSG